MVAVKQNGLALQYVEKKTPALCLAAVKQNGYALEYVKNPTPILLLEAVKQNGIMLQLIKEQTPELCKEAIKQNYRALKSVKGTEIIELVTKFGTYNGPLRIYQNEYGQRINAGCWFGDLDAFKVKVMERFALGFDHQTKEDLEDIIQQLQEMMH